MQDFLPTISAVTKGVLQGLLMVLGYLFKEEYRYTEDYRVVLARSMASSAPEPDQPDAEGFFSRPPFGKRNRPRIMSPLLTLHLWCLNPAVAFSEIAEIAHCVVLSSGTLAPLTSFASELNTPFPIQLEANHVIPENQLWVGSLGQGPSGRPLCATYKNVDTFPFQDELGDLLLAVSQIVPNGLLCFVPSYRILERLTVRWRNTGLWQRLEDTKMVLCEPRRGNRTTMDCLISQYYSAVKVGGALLLGVCRGKVCEGLDFTDERARAVVTVGIPFPSFKDHQVELKRRYNDQRVKRGLLSGSHWYDIQAYRALNQALGRCIRHKNDWGSLLLVDERFAKNSKKYISGLSRWMRQRIRHNDNCSTALQSLSSFLNSRLVPNTEVQHPRCASTVDIPSTSVTTTMHHTNLNFQSPHYNSQAKNSSPSSSKPNTSQPSKSSQSFLPSVMYAELPRTFLPLPSRVCTDVGSQNNPISPSYSDVSPTQASVTPLRPTTSSDLQKCRKTIDKYFSPRAKIPVDVINGVEENVTECCEPKRATTHCASQSLFSSTSASKVDDLSMSCSSPVSSDALLCSPPLSPVLAKQPATRDPPCLPAFEPDDLISCDLASADSCDEEMANNSQELFSSDWPEETISGHVTTDQPIASPKAQSESVSPIVRRVKTCRLSRSFHKSFFNSP
uniref:Fanconi anemia group J protein homolog n=1 Tax=Myxine glutinosa TaxID=7769 RepID=UPI00358E39C6